MSVLSNVDITREMSYHNIWVDPYNRKNQQPASYDVTLHNEFLIIRATEIVPEFLIDIREPVDHLFHHVTVDPGDCLILAPGDFVLASTVETFGFAAGYLGRLEGRSSIGRLGLLVHITAGYMDPGFHGPVTLEMKNLLPCRIAIPVGMRIGHMTFEEMRSPASLIYGVDPRLRSKYQDQAKPQVSQLWKDFRDVNSDTTYHVGQAEKLVLPRRK